MRYLFLSIIFHLLLCCSFAQSPAVKRANSLSLSMVMAKKPERARPLKKAQGQPKTHQQAPIKQQGEDDNKDAVKTASAQNIHQTDGDFSRAKDPQLLNGDALIVDYPAKAKYRGIQGRVRLSLTIAESGEVIKSTVVFGQDFDLEAAALKLVKAMRFSPGLDEEGQPKVSEVEHEVVFTLTRRS